MRRLSPRRVGEGARMRVVVGEPRRGDGRARTARRRRRCRPGASRRRTCGDSARAVSIASRAPASSEPPGAPRPFDSDTATRSNGARQLGRRAARRDRRVPQPRAVEEGGDAALARRRADALGLVLRRRRRRRRGCACSRSRPASSADRCRGPRGLQRGDELVGGEHAAGADLGELHAGVGRRAAGLVPHRVALAADDHVVAGPRQHAQRDLVGHRARRQPERRLLAEQRRRRAPAAR